jgi:hypothetical protein
MSKLLELLNKGVRNPRRAAEYVLDHAEDSAFALGVLLNSRLAVGGNIFDYDWDMLILLDGCRTDALNLVSDGYGFYKNPSTTSGPSGGTRSNGWRTRSAIGI